MRFAELKLRQKSGCRGFRRWLNKFPGASGKMIVLRAVSPDAQVSVRIRLTSRTRVYPLPRSHAGVKSKRLYIVVISGTEIE